MIKYYKLVGYEPFWTKLDKKYPKEHIETILENVSYSSKKFANGKKRNESHWVEITNVDWKAINDCSITAYQDEIPTYLKVDNNGIIYYYYLLDTPMVYASKDDKSQYKAIYELDTYMTIWWNKLQIMREHNPRVYANRGFFNRWAERVEENTLYYYFDFVDSKWIGQTLSNRNNQLVRKIAYYTNEQDIYSLNFPDTTIPTSYEVEQFDSTSSKWEIPNFNTKLTTPNSRGRYLYFVAKSTAKMTTANEKLVNNHTNQKFILIPFFTDMEVDFWRGLNDFDITKTGSFLVPSGDNEIGIYECDIPYSIFYGYVANNKYGATMKFANQPMRDSSNIKIPFFEIDNNAPILLKIIDFDRYKQGFSGKFDYLVNNITTWIPDTEPSFLNPAYYREIYKIGDSQIIIDASMFTYKWNADEIKNFGVEAYLSFSSGLNIAYNFGENTNHQLSTFDNTETTNGTISITNMYMGSNSATYFTTNSSTLATSLANRKSEETQAWVDAGLDTAKLWVKASPKSLYDITLGIGKTAGRLITAGIETAKIMTDTALQQERANKELTSSINNITSAPSQTLSASDVKGVIPNKYGLFETYSLELHPDDRDVLFSDFTHNGYPMNYMCYFNDVADNRQIMNVINLNTTYFEDDLMLLLSQYDTSFFNTKFWNNQFLAFLNSNISIYNTRTFVNCTDYLGDYYVANIEKELPDIPVPTTYIGKYIKNFRESYEANKDFILEALEQDNPDIPPEYSDIWESINIEQLEFGGFIISAKADIPKFYGSIVVNATCYNGYINENGIYHYFWNVDFLCGTGSSKWIITCPDGTNFDNEVFNYPIFFIEKTTFTEIQSSFLIYCISFNQPITLPNSLTSIGFNFLSHCTSFNQPITLPNSLTSIDNYFMNYCSNFNQPITLPNSLTSISFNFLNNCTSFNQPITLPNSLTSIDNYFMSSSKSFNQPITLPNSLTSIGTNFMSNCDNMISQINIQNIEATMFNTSSYTLTTRNIDAPMYETGIEIVGQDKTNFLARFPNHDTSPYRKLK